jgi:biopolymer transport protein ExbB
LEGSGRREAKALENRLDFLSMLAAVSPLLGLLGTITGMINTFVVVRMSGLGDPMKLSGGISEALICTAAGLVVAIPAVVFHRYFLHKVDGFVMDMEEMAEKVLSLAGR